MRELRFLETFRGDRKVNGKDRLRARHKNIPHSDAHSYCGLRCCAVCPVPGSLDHKIPLNFDPVVRFKDTENYRRFARRYKGTLS